MELRMEPAGKPLTSLGLSFPTWKGCGTSTFSFWNRVIYENKTDR